MKATMKYIKITINSWYINTFNLKLLFFLKQRIESLDKTHVEENIKAKAITWLSQSIISLSASLFIQTQKAISCR